MGDNRANFVILNGFVKVGLAGAECRECGRIKDNGACRHATRDQIEDVRRPMRHELRDRALREGGGDALGQLIDEIYRGVILKHVRRYRTAKGAKEDDFQEVALKLVQIIRERKGQFSAKTLQRWTRWLARVSQNVGGNIQKKTTEYKLREEGRCPALGLKVSVEGAKEAIAEQVVSGSDGPITEVMRRELAGLVGDMLDRLSRRYGREYAQVLELWVFEDLAVKEIAVRLGVGVDVVRWRLKMARDALRDLLRLDCETLYLRWQKLHDPLEEESESR